PEDRVHRPPLPTERGQVRSTEYSLRQLEPLEQLFVLQHEHHALGRTRSLWVSSGGSRKATVPSCTGRSTPRVSARSPCCSMSDSAGRWGTRLPIAPAGGLAPVRVAPCPRAGRFA